MKIDKKDYYRLLYIRKYRRILRRSCKKFDGAITRIRLEDSFGDNILKSRRYKARLLKKSFAEHFKNN